MGNPNAPRMRSLMPIDQVETATAIAAIEVYGSAAAVPVELQRIACARISQGAG